MSRATAFELPQHVRKPLEPFARVARGAIVVSALVCGAEAVLLFVRAAAIDDAVAYAEKYRLAITGTVPVSVTSVCFAGASIAGLFAWLGWQYRAQANLLAGGRSVRYTPSWSVMWWFVPVADLWMPAVTMSDLWRGSFHGSDEGGGSSWRIWLWWWPFVIGFLVRIVGHTIRTVGLIAAEAPSAPPGYPGISADDVVGFTRVGSVSAGIGDVLLLLAAPLALLVLGGVTRRQAAIATADGNVETAPPRPDRSPGGVH